MNNCSQPAPQPVVGQSSRAAMKSSIGHLDSIKEKPTVYHCFQFILRSVRYTILLILTFGSLLTMHNKKYAKVSTAVTEKEQNKGSFHWFGCRRRVCNALIFYSSSFRFYVYLQDSSGGLNRMKCNSRA